VLTQVRVAPHPADALGRAGERPRAPVQREVERVEADAQRGRVGG
jgi:hypothetical protein